MDSDDPEDLDDAALSLRRSLIALSDLTLSDLYTETAPAGAKGLGLDMGALAVTVLGTRQGLRTLIDTVRVWVERDSNRKVVVRLGADSVEIEGFSPERSRELAEAFIQRHTGD
ncbi:hypothetical protein ACWGCW_35710 [Streptomyces sp. NPDC054933]